MSDGSTLSSGGRSSERGGSMRWVVIFDDNEGRESIRKEQSGAHFEYLAANRDKIVIAGGLRTAPGEWYCGWVWVMEVDWRDEAVRLIEGDPYLPARPSQRLSSPGLGQGSLLRDREPVGGWIGVRVCYIGVQQLARHTLRTQSQGFQGRRTSACSRRPSAEADTGVRWSTLPPGAFSRNIWLHVK